MWRSRKKQDKDNNIVDQRLERYETTYKLFIRNIQCIYLLYYEYNKAAESFDFVRVNAIKNEIHFCLFFLGFSIESTHLSLGLYGFKKLTKEQRTKADVLDWKVGLLKKHYERLVEFFKT